MNKRIRQGTFEHLRVANPHPTTELNFNSFFELFTTVLLSAQATDVGVNKATVKLFPVTVTPQTMLGLGPDGVMEYTKTIGFYGTESKHIVQTCRILLEKYHGETPADRPALEALPRMGRRTVNAVLNTAFGQPVMAVNTHTFRVPNRTKTTPGKGVCEVEDKLIRFVPKEFPMDTHHWLILHGRYICKALKPQCEIYIINDLCKYPAKLMQSGEKGRLKPRRFAASGGIGVYSGKFQ